MEPLRCPRIHVVIVSVRGATLIPPRGLILRPYESPHICGGPRAYAPISSSSNLSLWKQGILRFRRNNLFALFRARTVAIAIDEWRPVLKVERWKCLGYQRPSSPLFLSAIFVTKSSLYEVLAVLHKQVPNGFVADRRDFDELGEAVADLMLADISWDCSPVRLAGCGGTRSRERYGVVRDMLRACITSVQPLPCAHLFLSL